MAANQGIFKTKKRIRLGLWGLGRGFNFYQTCAALNMDVVAGCDYNLHMRESFKKAVPDGFVTDSEDEFLAQNFDAVLLATYCPAHADDAIKCLKAGKHVLSEVTAFHTMAEGVRLVEAVEKSGLVYNLAENYPFIPQLRYLTQKWQEGIFGEMMYAEFEYVHECRSLVYTYIDGVPVVPGDTLHNWRSWLNFHYYNTHSLGPVMIMTGLRPTRVTALPGEQHLPGYPLPGPVGMGGIAPSLINMSNGSVMRNLMGATTNDTHTQRIWGTRGSAVLHGDLSFRLGAAGCGPMMTVAPELDDLGKIAQKTGHGGGDFWVLYYFARQILTGETAPFDIYVASDCTIPGIQAVRSSLDGGKPYEVPDFRKKKERDKYRNDDFDQPRFDADKGCFPKSADKALTGKFTTMMRDLVQKTTAYRSYTDWSRFAGEAKEPQRILDMADALIASHPKIISTIRNAQELAAKYPKSDGARLINEMLADIEPETVTAPGYLKRLKKERIALEKRMTKR